MLFKCLQSAHRMWALFCNDCNFGFVRIHIRKKIISDDKHYPKANVICGQNPDHFMLLCIEVQEWY